ncbi:MAG: response regulator transcription factor [Actinomycetota bacterium]|nr:response regulator transcription factor [Actinomycetota bacterium]
MADQIRVLLADDHPVVRQGLRAFLESRDGIVVVGEASDGAQAVAMAARLRPDVVVMDLVMPGMDGVTATSRIATSESAPRVLVLTSFAAEEQVVPAVRAGAAGYLLKDAEPRAVEDAVRRVAAGEFLLHPQAAARLMVEVATDAPARPSRTNLTPREVEVLGLLAGGLSNRQLARKLVISEKTVKTHVSSILSKLGLADRTQAALYAVREGLVEPDPRS